MLTPTGSKSLKVTASGGGLTDYKYQEGSVCHDASHMYHVE